MFDDLLEKVKENYYLVAAIVLALVVVGYFLYQRFYVGGGTSAPAGASADHERGPSEESGAPSQAPKLDTNSLVGVHVDEAMPFVKDSGFEAQVLPEGSAVTKDLQPNRVRLFVDDSGVIVSAMQG